MSLRTLDAPTILARWRTLFTIAVGLLGTCLVLFAVSQTSAWYVYDDAFITYRYAENLRRGLGFVYTPSEPVLGTTAPLFGLLLGGIGWLLPDVEMVWIGHWVNVIAWCSTLWATIALFRSLHRPLMGAIAVLMLALQPSLLAILGMETPFIVMLMLLSAFAWNSDRRILAVVASAALILARQDGALWVLILGMDAWWRRRRLPWEEAVATVMLCLPWIAYAQWTYGSFLPNSILAKIGQTSRMTGVDSTPFFMAFWQFWRSYHNPFYLMIVLPAAGLGMWIIITALRNLFWLPVWIAAYLTVYWMLGVDNFHWYFVPPITAMLLLVAVGLGDRLAAALNTIHSKGWKKNVAGGLATATLILLLIDASAAIKAASTARSSMHVAGHLSSYHLIGDWLAEHSDPADTVATIEIGVIGYRSMRPLLDTMGLVSPQMIPHLTGWSDSLIFALTQFWPAYAVVLPNTAWEGVVSQWWFQEHYQLVDQFGVATLYRRVSLPTAEYLVELTVSYTNGLILQQAHLETKILRPAQTVTVWLDWYVQERPDNNLQFTFYWIDTQTDGRFAQETIWPYYLQEAYPANHWPTDTNIQLPVRITVPTDLSPGTYRLGLFLYDPVEGRGIPLASAPDVGYPEVQIGYFRLESPPSLVVSERRRSIRVDQLFEEGIRLKQIHLPQDPLNPEDVLPIDMIWQVEDTPNRDLTVYVHLLSDTGMLSAQRDVRPFEGRFPTPAWRLGEILHDRILLLLPETLAPGLYSIRVGLYDAVGRLPLEDGADDSIFFQNSVEIGSN
ncbi:MAG: hypothetical protein KF893_07005 [Caldilineaceae bacterium]|nr:hypothetical protein [Caldilineaceae bacterium]